VSALLSSNWIATRVVNHSELDSASFSRSELSTLLHRRTRGGVAGYKPIGRAQQVSQHTGIDARKANQNSVVSDVMVRHVVNIGRLGEQLRAIIEIYSDDKRTGFSRAMNGDGRQEFSMGLECRTAVSRAFLHAGKLKSDFPHRGEVDCVFWHSVAAAGRRGRHYPKEPKRFQHRAFGSLLLEAGIVLNIRNAAQSFGPLFKKGGRVPAQAPFFRRQKASLRLDPALRSAPPSRHTSAPFPASNSHRAQVRRNRPRPNAFIERAPNTLPDSPVPPKRASDKPLAFIRS
jgi:hypothetical protein